MRKYLLPVSCNPYKANLHCHTTDSDGKLSPEEVKSLYMRLGYSIVAYTDHDILLSRKELCDSGFLALNGFELEVEEEIPAPFSQVRTCHMCFIAIEPDNLTQCLWHRGKYLKPDSLRFREQIKYDRTKPDFERSYDKECINYMMKTGRECGFFVTYNHPTWSLEDYPEYIGYNNMNAMEMFNGSCIASGFNDYNPRVYDDMLRAGKRIYCIGGDDNHNFHSTDTRRSDSGWAYTVILAERLEYRSVTSALERGHFYASEGPQIHELWYEDGKVHIKCSDADRINCTFGKRHVGTVLSENGQPVNEAEFEIPRDGVYFRITVIDRFGKHACTNAYFIDEIAKENENNV